MNIVRRGGKKGHLAKSSANYSRDVHEQCSPEWEKGNLANNLPTLSRTFHEQCSPGLQNMSFGEQFGELFANCSSKCTTFFGIENGKITVSSSHSGTVRYTINVFF
jgi:hypothetical protein